LNFWRMKRKWKYGIRLCIVSSKFVMENSSPNRRKRLDMIEDFDVGGVSLWELGQVESILSRLTVARDSITFMNSFELMPPT
jgi:hypothetical protein